MYFGGSVYLTSFFGHPNQRWCRNCLHNPISGKGTAMIHTKYTVQCMQCSDTFLVSFLNSISKGSSRICPLMLWLSNLSNRHYAMVKSAKCRILGKAVSVCRTLKKEPNFRTVLYNTMLLFLPPKKLFEPL